MDQWHCCLLANMIDARAAVGLARSGDVDKRLFLEPPLRYHNFNKDMLVNVMRDFLINLYEKSQHQCLGYFLSKVFVYEHWIMGNYHHKDNSHIVDNDSSALELSKFIQSEDDVMPKCLESLLHHSSIRKYTKDIVDENALPLLMEIYHRYKRNIEMNIKLCQIISYMSFDRNILGPMHKSGWIGVLYDWTKHDDVRISIPAARALANLDFDSQSIYNRYIYLLYPITRTSSGQELDVVFVHGLLGGVFYTWRQRKRGKNILSITESITPGLDSMDQIIRNKTPKQMLKSIKEKIEFDDSFKEYEIVWDDIPVYTNTNGDDPYTCPATQYVKCKDNNDCHTYCWPKDWLPEDCSNLRILGVNYDTSLSMWAPICPTEKVKFTLEERSDDLIERFLGCGLGEKPIVWVTHSMGGLIVKNILCKAFESKDENIKKICSNTKGVIFYSTPHKGSRLANLSQATALLLWPSVEVQELRENSPKLRAIHEKFLNIVKEAPMKIVTFVETKSTVVTALKFNFLLVEPKSGNPSIGEYYEIPQDHLGICKPISKNSFLYQKVLHVLQEILKETQKKNQKLGN
ncbi:unnamed protein product [Acanthoscelides obtectus]|uniref:Protein SERAC1 n=1 Tax=Acanthoscelides obtectus TaxID=200917 RepID=A0A9P0LF88_ACAOB|nr:unnamed protein product [Acanthoscelides obtectus]CAK1649852.1 Protein SERAC1 [Acanthoscelides obtectus]